MTAKWTKEMDAKLLDLWERGKKGSEIAVEFERPRNSVLGRLDRLRSRLGDAAVPRRAANPRPKKISVVQQERIRKVEMSAKLWAEGHSKFEICRLVGMTPVTFSNFRRGHPGKFPPRSSEEERRAEQGREARAKSGETGFTLRWEEDPVTAAYNPAFLKRARMNNRQRERLGL
jgi:hypothetical protein